MGRDMRVGIEPIDRSKKSGLKKKATKPECLNGNCEPHIITIEDILAASAKKPEEALVAGTPKKESACPAIEVCDKMMCPQNLGIPCQESEEKEASGAEAIAPLFEGIDASPCAGSSCDACGEDC